MVTRGQGFYLCLFYIDFSTREFLGPSMKKVKPFTEDLKIDQKSVADADKKAVMLTSEAVNM